MKQEYDAYLVKVGKAYLKQSDFIDAKNHELTFDFRKATNFMERAAYDIAKKYGGQVIGLLLIELDDGGVK